MNGWRAVRGGMALAIVAALAVGCAQIIGVPDETKSVAEDFCKCDGDENLDDAWPGETCVAHVEGRLSTAEPDVLAAWLQTYRDEDCGTCTNTAGRQTCKSSAPICAAVGASCQNTSLCCTPPGQDVYCGAQNVCVSESACIPPFGACDPNAPDGALACCGEVAFTASCVPSDGGAYCLERCDPADPPPSCQGCCAFFGQVTAGTPTEDHLCVSEKDCLEACDPANGDPCPVGNCHPNVQRVGGTIYTVDACLNACDPDAVDTCGGSSCCVKFKDLTTMQVVGRCLPQGQATCTQRCGVRDADGTPITCKLGTSLCEENVLPVGPAGPFSVFLCR